MPAAPAAADKSINLAVKGTMDADDILSSIRKMGTGWYKEMNVIQKQSDRATKGVFKDFHKMWGKSTKITKDYATLYEKTLKQEDAQAAELQKAWKGVGASIVENEEALDRISKFKINWLRDDAASKMEAQSKAIDKIKAKIVKLNETKASMAASMEEFNDSGREGSETIKEKMELDTDEMKDSAEKAGELLAKPFDMLLSKDIPGTIKTLVGLMSKGTIGLGKMAGEKAAAMHKEAGGGAADPMKGMAKALEAVSGTMKTIGPMLSMAGGFVMGLVQLFIAADAAAKGFNKEIMATAGNAEFLSDSMGDAEMASEDMKKSLHGMYKEATDFAKNYTWGITKEQFASTSGALTAEGVGLKKLDKEYLKTSGTVKGFGDLVRMSVGYSAAFGVSLQEIGQFEGEMLSELGMSLDQVEAGFQGMLRGAEESGIATNKFFSIIRGFSTDLTYFTIRMDSVTTMMTRLGKAMSPRDAQKFMQGLSSFFKGKGLGELTADVLMGGEDATNTRLQKSMDEKLSSLAVDIAHATGSPMEPKDLKKILRKSDKELAKWLEEDGAKLSEDQKKAVMSAAGRQYLLDQHNPVATASALADSDMMETLEQLEAQSNHMFGVGIKDLKGTNLLAAENVLHLSDEQRKSIGLLNKGIERMKAGLIAKLGKQDRLNELLAKKTLTSEEEIEKRQLSLTEDERIALEKLQSIVGKGNNLDNVNAASAVQVARAMEGNQKKDLEGAKHELNAQELMAKNTTSMETQIDILSAFLMGAFYNVVTGIYDFIQKMAKKVGLGLDPKVEQLSALERKAVARGDTALLKAITATRASGGSLDDVKAAYEKPIQELKAAMEKEKDPEQYKVMVKKLADLQESMKTGAANIDAAVSSVAASKAEIEQTQADVKTGAGVGAAMLPMAAPLGGAIGAVLLPSLKELLPKDVLGDINVGLTQANKDAGAIWGRLKEFVGQATHPGSIYTHDIHLEKLNKKAYTDEDKASDALQRKFEDATNPNFGGPKWTASTYSSEAPEAPEELQDETEDQGSTLADIWKALRVRGIKIDKPFLENSIKPVFRDAVYDAAGEALEDYYILSQANPKAVLAAIKSGNAGKGKVASMLNASMRPSTDKDGKTKAGEGDLNKTLGMVTTGPKAPAHAAGGLVTGIGSNGMAQVSPAPGEGFTSIGKGERITPAGAGGGGGKQVIELVLKGDLGRIIDVRAQNVVSNHETMKSRR